MPILFRMLVAVVAVGVKVVPSPEAHPSPPPPPGTLDALEGAALTGHKPCVWPKGTAWPSAFGPYHSDPRCQVPFYDNPSLPFNFQSHNRVRCLETDELVLIN